MFGILISVFISTLISAISTLISVTSMLSVYALLTKCGAFAGFWYVCQILVRLPHSGTFAGFWCVCWILVRSPVWGTFAAIGRRHIFKITHQARGSTKSGVFLEYGARSVVVLIVWR